MQAEPAEKDRDHGDRQIDELVVEEQALAGIKAFTAAVLGGIGSLPGAMLGGLLIGLIEVFWAGYFSSEYKDVAVFAILVLVLIFRPTGLLGKPEIEKV